MVNFTMCISVIYLACLPLKRISILLPDEDCPTSILGVTRSEGGSGDLTAGDMMFLLNKTTIIFIFI